MNEELDGNEDPTTGEPGAHPVGAGVGTVGGVASGAAMGTAAGPVGAVAGAVIGGLAGAAVGRTLAEHINPTQEDAYWRENHSRQLWASADDDFDTDYAPAYRHGYTGILERDARSTWEDAESELEHEWDEAKSDSRLSWEKAKHPARAGWRRVERAIPGDFDGDGR